VGKYNLSCSFDRNRLRVIWCGKDWWRK